MTPQERDELASAYLDGEATAEERAMVEADPALLARAEQLRHAAAEVAGPVAEAGREEIIAQALESFKPAEAKSSKLPAWLGQRKRKMPKLRISSRGRLRNPHLVPIFSVAAVLVVVFLAISVIVLLSDDTGDDDSDAVASRTTSAATQALESALAERSDEMSAASAATAAATTAAATPAPAIAAAQLVAPEDAVSADDASEAAFAPATTSAAQFVSPPDADDAAPAAEGRTSDLPEETAEGIGDLNAAGPPLAGPPPPESADFAMADTGASECPTEEGLAAPSEDDDSEGELEEEEEPAPGDPDAIERSAPPSSDTRPDTELETPEPPSVASPPPADSSDVSSDTIPPDHEDAISEDASSVECP